MTHDPTHTPEFVRLMKRMRISTTARLWRDDFQQPLPEVDMIIVPDAFEYMTNNQIKRAIRMVYDSGARFLVATNYPGQRHIVNKPADGPHKPNLAWFGMIPIILMDTRDHGKTLTLFGVNHGRRATAE